MRSSKCGVGTRKTCCEMPLSDTEVESVLSFGITAWQPRHRLPLADSDGVLDECEFVTVGGFDDTKACSESSGGLFRRPTEKR